MAKKYYSVKVQPIYAILLFLSIAWTIGGILTLIPNPLANKPTILGYLSLCTFAPAATLFCFMCAGITCTIRAVFFKKDSRGAHAPFREHLFTLIPILILLAGGVAAAIAWDASARSFRYDIVTEIDSDLPAGLRDGTFTGKWVSDEVEAEVELVVSGGKVVRARLLSGRNVPDRIADTMFTGMIGKQSLALDAVTGATASSSVVLKACEQALLAAVGR